jgi:hypothetical protein
MWSVGAGIAASRNPKELVERGIWKIPSNTRVMEGMTGGSRHEGGWRGDLRELVPPEGILFES